jgi:hypothetical protein
MDNNTKINNMNTENNDTNKMKDYLNFLNNSNENNKDFISIDNIKNIIENFNQYFYDTYLLEPSIINKKINLKKIIFNIINKLTQTEYAKDLHLNELNKITLKTLREIIESDYVEYLPQKNENNIIRRDNQVHNRYEQYSNKPELDIREQNRILSENQNSQFNKINENINERYDAFESTRKFEITKEQNIKEKPNFTDKKENILSKNDFDSKINEIIKLREKQLLENKKKVNVININENQNQNQNQKELINLNENQNQKELINLNENQNQKELINLNENQNQKELINLNENQNQKELINLNENQNQKELINLNENQNQKELINLNENQNQKELINLNENQNQKELINLNENQNQKELINLNENQNQKELINLNENEIEIADENLIPNNNFFKHFDNELINHSNLNNNVNNNVNNNNIFNNKILEKEIILISFNSNNEKYEYIFDEKMKLYNIKKIKLLNVYIEFNKNKNEPNYIILNLNNLKLIKSNNDKLNNYFSVLMPNKIYNEEYIFENNLLNNMEKIEIELLNYKFEKYNFKKSSEIIFELQIEFI